MAIAFFEGDDSRLEDDEIRLGEPIDAEADNLPLHVNRCAARYSVTVRRLNRLDRKADQNRLLLFLLIGAVILLSPTSWSVVATLLK